MGLSFLIFLRDELIFFKFKSSGFSQKITFLYFAPFSINFKCVEVEEAIKIHLISLSLKAISGLFIEIELNFFETLFDRFLFKSKTYFNSNSLFFL